MKSLVWSSTVQFYLKVFFGLSQIGWVLFHVHHSSGMDEWVVWISLIWVELHSFVFIKCSCEIITLNNSVDSSIDLEFNSDTKVGPVEVSSFLWMWELMSLQENTLWDSAILNSWF